MNYYCCGITDKGNVHNHNEDGFLLGGHVFQEGIFEKEKISSPFIVAVADGVGGENSGEVASKMALTALKNIRPSEKTDYVEKIKAIHEKIKKYGLTHPEQKNMQTTLCGIAIERSGKIKAINIGDSRIYRIHANKIKQLSNDQSLYNILYGGGQYKELDRMKSDKKNIILPVLGCKDSEPLPDIFNIDPIEYGDVLLICSDGLSDYVTSGEIEEIMEHSSSLRKRLSELVQKALSNGSGDNITILCIIKI